MIIQRTKFFLLILALILAIFLTPKIAWLSHTQRTKGFIAFEGKGEADDQVVRSYTGIWGDTLVYGGIPT